MSMNYLLTSKLFEATEGIDINDYGWLYFLTYLYPTGMAIESWRDSDHRMGKNNTPPISFGKFPYVTIKDGSYQLTDVDKAKSVLDNLFGSKTFADSLRKCEEIPEQTPDGRDAYDIYPLKKIPSDLFMKKNPKLRDSFDRISNRFTEHWNSMRSDRRILERFSKSRNIKEWSFKNYYYTFPEEPETFKIYRGLASDFDEEQNEDGYSCWTTDRDQGIRFAIHHFTGGKQFSPTFNEKAILLSTEVSLKDVSIFIGGQEREVVMKNPVSNIKVDKLKPGTKDQ
jgi:hypothetical protein